MEYFEQNDPEEAIGRLLRHAGPRPLLPERFRDEIEAVARASWRAKVMERAAARRRRGFLLAAAVTIAVAGALFFVSRFGRLGPGSDATYVATVEAFSGSPVDATGEPLLPGAELGAGARIATTAHGHAALTLTGGTALRLAAATRLRLVSATVLELEAGEVYLDTGDAAPALEVRTALGTARDVGTQFAVRIDDESLRVQVREGTVELQPAGAAPGEPLERAGSGTALILRPGTGVERAAVATWGEPWRWVLESAPPFVLEGATVADVLDWVSRETGWRVEWADPKLEQEAATIIVHGSLGDLSPDQAPAVVLPTSGLEYRLEEGVLTVFRP